MTHAPVHAPARRPDTRAAARPPRHAPPPGLVLRRCACGGGCPACRARTSASPDLPINTPGDPWEREAERAADAVMSASPASLSRSSAGPALRRCACGGSCPSCRKKEEDAELRRDDAGAGGAPAFAPPVVHDVLASPGRPLDGGVRTFMEARFGADFGGVRVHDDARAAESARAVDAHAYAVGSDVVFGAGRYAPGTAAGDRLIAHELAHTLQQAGTARRLQRACGEAAIGARPLDCVMESIEPGGKRFLFKGGCDEFEAGQEAALRNYVTALPADAEIEIVGVASSDGDETFNAKLSCSRATAAAEVIETAGRGDSITRVRATGEKGEEGDVTFRAVAIVAHEAPPKEPEDPPGPAAPELPPGTPPDAPPAPMSCAQVTAEPGSSTPMMLGWRGTRGTDWEGGPDYEYLDNPVLTTAQATAVFLFRQMSTFTLQAIMGGELSTLGGEIGTKMFAQFAMASQAMRTHGVGSPLSTEVSKSLTFLRAWLAAMLIIDSQVQAQAAACHIDWRTLHLFPPELPDLTFAAQDGDSVQLNAVLGGTQGLTVSIVDFTVPPGGRTYAARLIFEIYDDFGVDDTDLDPSTGHGSPGLFAFWVLQHERPTHTPFVNHVVVDVPISGSF